MKQRFALIAGLVGASLLTPLAASAAQAQNGVMTYERCMQERQNRQVAGALVGGLLGAVVGAEIHDDNQDKERERWERRRDRHDRYDRRRDRRDRYDRYDRDYDRYDRRRDRRDRYDRYDRDYDRYDRRRHRDYDRRRRHRDRHWDEEGNDGAVIAGGAVGALAGAAIASAGDCEQYRRGSSTTYSQPYPTQSNSGGGYYDNQFNNQNQGHQDYSYDNELAGAPGSSSQGSSRAYSASSSGPASTGNCRYMSAGAGRQTYMCQGTDGVWRPN